MGARISHDVAQLAAGELLQLLGPYCERLAVAGSLRRGAESVKDIELVAIARTETIARDLFGEQTDTVSLLEPALASMHRGRILTPREFDGGRTVWGPRTKYAQYFGIPVDLFIVAPPTSWGVVMTLRTGPADFSRQLVTSNLQGGWCTYPLRFKDGQLWKGQTALECPEEIDVFTALELEYIEPHERGQRPVRRAIDKETPTHGPIVIHA